MGTVDKQGAVTMQELIASSVAQTEVLTKLLIEKGLITKDEFIRRQQMGTVDKQGVVTMQELIASSLAQTDALTKLLIEKGLITEAEFMQKLSAERVTYQAMLGKTRHNDGR